jgi:hypothetical protein
MTLDELIAASVYAFASEFQRTGIVPAGSNGARGHDMTSIRNAGHWLYALCVVNAWQPTPLISKVANRLRDQLLSPEGRPFGFTHRFRRGHGDGCNGVIGPAWAIESLVKAGVALNDERCLDLAEELFFLHEFSNKIGLWYRREIDGTVQSIDQTFDHQLWFAACASEIRHRRRREITARLERFLECLPENMLISENGRIRHLVKERRSAWRVLASRLKIELKQALKMDLTIEISYPAEVLEAGYHAFSTHALAILATQFPQHPVIHGEKVRRVIKYLQSPEYPMLLEENIFGYFYNPPGFEVPFSLSVLSDMDEDALIHTSTFWVNEQIRRTFDFATNALNRNTADPATLRARVYEATRIPYSILTRIEIARGR